MRIFSAAYLSQKSLVKEARPARNAAEVGKAGSGSSAMKLEMFTMAPPCYVCIIGVTRRHTRTTFKK